MYGCPMYAMLLTGSAGCRSSNTSSDFCMRCTNHKRSSRTMVMFATWFVSLEIPVVVPLEHDQSAQLCATKTTKNT